MPRLLVHLSTGPENPTKGALAMLVARTASAGGHDVDVFVAGDAVAYLRPETLDLAQGIGTGSLREHVRAAVDAGVRIHASGLSSRARALTPQSVGDLEVSFDPPDALVRLTFEADRVLSY